jgi:hypothetical protein
MNIIPGSWSEKLLRAAVAFTFIYPAVSAWFNPYAWIGYFPSFLLDFADAFDGLGVNGDLVLLHVFGATEIIIAVWILFARSVFVPSIIAGAYLLGIIVFNWNQMDVIFRDVSILLAATALALGHVEKPTTTNIR